MYIIFVSMHHSTQQVIKALEYKEARDLVALPTYINSHFYKRRTFHLIAADISNQIDYHFRRTYLTDPFTLVATQLMDQHIRHGALSLPSRAPLPST